jgi:hypothetical protein
MAGLRLVRSKRSTVLPRMFACALAPAAVMFSLGVTTSVSGCSKAPDASSSAAAETKDPNQMPDEVVALENQGCSVPNGQVSASCVQSWGMQHLEWHTVRQWDMMASEPPSDEGQSDLQWAESQCWKRAAIQEGAAGNGYEFLVMHRAMLTILRTKFPQYASLFAGWTTPPTSPTDPSFPVPKNPGQPASSDKFDPDMLAAIKAIGSFTDPSTNKPFASDDAFGLYIETSLRPTKSDPNKQSSVSSVGLHNYIHNRFSDSNSPIDLGQPALNLANKIFWDLHGWIDAQWMAFQKSQHPDTTDSYWTTLNSAVTQQEPMFQGMSMQPSCPASQNVGASLGGDQGPPASLGMSFEQENNWGGGSGDVAGGGDDGGGDDSSDGDDGGSGDDSTDGGIGDDGGDEAGDDAGDDGGVEGQIRHHIQARPRSGAVAPR